MPSRISLSMLAGPLVPVPVPREVVEALTSVQVMTTGDQSGFQLTFDISKRSPLQTVFLLTGGALPPVFRVVLYATINGTTVPLIDGMMAHHQISPAGEGGTSTLTVTGKDMSAAMDLIDFSGFPYPAMPPEARVVACIGKYAFLGVIPKVIPSVLIDVPIPVERIPRHQGTDRAYIKQLADDVGYVFYLEPGPVPATSVAYWGPQIKVGAPQPALNLDMDAHTNVQSLSFSFDTESATLPIVLIQNPQTHVPIPIPVPPITPLNPPLGLIPPIPKRFTFIDETAKLNPIQAALVGLAKAAKTADAATGTGTLDVLRYGRLLEPRKLVGVRGAGPAYDGLWYVSSVTSTLKRGAFTQSFTLSRNGLLSTVPRVPA